MRNEEALDRQREHLANAVHPLMQALKGECAEIRRRAAMALGLLRAFEAIDVLANVLATEVDDEVASIIIEVLADNLECKRSTQHLLVAIGNSRPSVRMLAFEALQSDRSIAFDLACKYATEDPIAHVRAAAVRYLRYSESAAIPYLRNSLGDVDSTVRADAIYSLETLDAKESIEELGKLLKFDSSEEVRRGAVSALGSFGTDSALTHLLEVCAVSGQRFRVEIIRALGEASNLLALDFLMGALEDRQDEIREASLFALTRLTRDYPHECGRLINSLGALITTDQNLSIQIAAIEVLAGLDSSKILPYILEALDDPALKQAAVGALTSIYDVDVLPNLLEILNTATNYKSVHLIVQYLIDRPDIRSIDILLKSFNGQEIGTYLKVEIAFALAAIGDDCGIEPVSSLLSDQSAEVRADALWALSFFSKIKVFPMLVSGLKDLDEQVRIIAARAMEELDESLNKHPRRIRLGRLHY